MTENIDTSHANRDLAAAAYWPPGFKERALALAEATVAKDAASVPSVLARVAETFPMFLSAAINNAHLPYVSTELMEVVSVALKACIKSVAIETAGTVTVVDLRTPPA